MMITLKLLFLRLAIVPLYIVAAFFVGLVKIFWAIMFILWIPVVAVFLACCSFRKEKVSMIMEGHFGLIDERDTIYDFFRRKSLHENSTILYTQETHFSSAPSTSQWGRKIKNAIEKED